MSTGHNKDRVTLCKKICMWNKHGTLSGWFLCGLIFISAGLNAQSSVPTFPNRIFIRSRDAVQGSLKDPVNRKILIGTTLFALGARMVDNRVETYAQKNGLMPQSVSHLGDMYGSYWSILILYSGIGAYQAMHPESNSMFHSKLEYATLALGANGIMTNLVKVAVGRQRPNHADYRSFPSGHTSNAFTVATVADQLYGHKVGAVAYSAATVVALSRINDNKHYLSDVIAGAGLGTIIARSFASAYQPQLKVHSGSRSYSISAVFYF